MMDGIGKDEVILINVYADGELGVALSLGKMVALTKNNKLRIKLIWHTNEEVRHASVFYKMMQNLKIPILNAYVPSQEDFWAYTDKQRDLNYRLALVHIRELRLPFHFKLHKKLAKNDDFKYVLDLMMKEEGPHLSWIRNYLIDTLGKEGFNKIVKKAFEFERKYYKKEMDLFRKTAKSEGKVLMEAIDKSVDEYENWVENSYLKGN